MEGHMGSLNRTKETVFLKWWTGQIARAFTNRGMPWVDANKLHIWAYKEQLTNGRFIVFNLDGGVIMDIRPVMDKDIAAKQGPISVSTNFVEHWGKYYMAVDIDMDNQHLHASYKTPPFITQFVWEDVKYHIISGLRRTRIIRFL